MEASCTVTDKEILVNSYREKDKKKKMARAISKNQVSDPGPSCFFKPINIISRIVTRKHNCVPVLTLVSAVQTDV